ncbi:dihydrolipoyl dehydrogenase [Paenibacillus elgii]|uniref:dihydrolipoyl dehydrogenase n=1 Tax=Paenibacillus elgii TaxID=189691 RepID=UPI000FD96CB6|nr:dihydrolipoyl dehydrogenase [Paenibacillus elgii]NEN81943.1 dihydrolipoyl dehydrogenase [Paenibacillus elgii]
METIAIIGGGPAGYVAAIAAAGQGKQVTLIEQKELGGTCLNEGCMPTKSLLESADTLDKVKHADRFGVVLPTDRVEVDWNAVQSYKNGIVSKLVQGIGFLMKKNKIRVIRGQASFVTDRKLQVSQGDRHEAVEADRFIIAAGSEPVALPFAPFDGEWIIHSGQAMSLPAVPASLLIIGGGVIGCEFASIYSRLGTRVTVVEMADQLLPGEDADTAAILQRELEKAGVKVYTSTAVKQLQLEEKLAVFETESRVFEGTADRVLVAIGRKPRTDGLGLEKARVRYTKQGIEVNPHMQTSVPHIYACGDIIGGIQLAHVAFHEGTVAALHASGAEAKVNYRAVPRCIYTSPEIAGVGLTEKQARERYGDIRVGEFPFAANGKALILDEPVGRVKVLTEPQYHEIVGISIVGPKATELIGQGAVLLHTEMTADMMEHFIAAHPTLSEAVHEAILGAIGHAVHV